MPIVIIDRSTCENNGQCFEVCPDEVFERSGDVVTVNKQDQCTYCWLCVEVCPTGAVTID